MNRNVERAVVDAGVNKAKVVLECPRCHWMFEAERPDGLHSTSFEKPQKRIVEGNVVEQKYVCRNPKCKNAFIVYWFEPTDSFSGI
jgi:hypothetical protein